MVNYIIRRILWAIPVLLVISLITFSLGHSIPGGPFDREKKLPQEIIANLEAYYGLDDPLWKQYTDYLWNALHGDLGPSYSSRIFSYSAFSKFLSSSLVFDASQVLTCTFTPPSALEINH